MSPRPPQYPPTGENYFAIVTTSGDRYHVGMKHPFFGEVTEIGMVAAGDRFQVKFKEGKLPDGAIEKRWFFIPMEAVDHTEHIRVDDGGGHKPQIVGLDGDPIQ